MNQGEAKPTGEVTMTVIRGNGPRQDKAIHQSLKITPGPIPCEHSTKMGRLLHKVIGW